MDIELLYFEECPSWENALAILQDVIGDSDLTTELRLTRVETDVEAAQTRFVGSPTIRINGEDLFPTGSTDYALGCRIYATPDGLQGLPSKDMLRKALDTHRSYAVESKFA